MGASVRSRRQGRRGRAGSGTLSRGAPAGGAICPGCRKRCWRVTLGASWILLLTRGAAGWRWQSPAVWTYLAIASSLWKVSAVRSGVPLPADRAEEHRQWLNRRRHGVRLLDCFSWFNVLVVAGYAALHSSPVTVPRLGCGGS
ncbi:MAG: hypothetical protein MZV70_07645 [Desulfobacterales bacterium]|nr:hypothetical protein [Desulfobacterales bacterium]